MSKLKVSIKKSTVTAMMKAGRKERINETELSQLAANAGKLKEYDKIKTE
mgnify:CR=1 FL=1